MPPCRLPQQAFFYTSDRTMDLGRSRRQCSDQRVSKKYNNNSLGIDGALV